MNDDGSVIMDEVIKCPFCGNTDIKINIKDINGVTVVCPKEGCEGRFKVYFDDEQQMYEMTKDLK